MLFFLARIKSNDPAVTAGGKKESNTACYMWRNLHAQRLKFLSD